jgi:hypothetical protein
LGAAADGGEGGVRLADDEVNKTKLLLALLIASGSGVLSVMMTRFPERIGAAVVLLFPGFVLSIITSGNVHDFDTWIVVLGNFVFYFGIVYLLCEFRERYARRAHADKR